MKNPFQTTEKQALEAYGKAIEKQSDSLLAASQRADKKTIDEWMKRAEAGEVVRIM